MTTETNPYEQEARERKAAKIATTALITTRKAAQQNLALPDHPKVALRIEHGAQLGLLLACLSGKHGTDVAMTARESLLADAGVKGASPETWKIVRRQLAEDYANLALNLCADDDPFAGLP